MSRRSSVSDISDSEKLHEYAYILAAGSPTRSEDGDIYEETGLKGGCYCGSITYTSTALPTSLTHCHCSTCRHLSGAPYMTFARFLTSSITFSPQLPPINSSPSSNPPAPTTTASPATLHPLKQHSTKPSYTTPSRGSISLLTGPISRPSNSMNHIPRKPSAASTSTASTTPASNATSTSKPSSTSGPINLKPDPTAIPPLILLDTSDIAQRAHCSLCSSPLLMRYRHEPEAIYIPCGTMNDETVRGTLPKAGARIFVSKPVAGEESRWWEEEGVGNEIRDEGLRVEEGFGREYQERIDEWRKRERERGRER